MSNVHAEISPFTGRPKVGTNRVTDLWRYRIHPCAGTGSGKGHSTRWAVSKDNQVLFRCHVNGQAVRWVLDRLEAAYNGLSSERRTSAGAREVFNILVAHGRLT